MAKQIRQTEPDMCCCEAHARAFNLASDAFILVAAAHEQADDEPIECEKCALHLMRSAGVI